MENQDILAAARGLTDLAPEPYRGGLTICPPGRVVALTECKGRMFLATELMVYELIDGIWHPMVFATGEEPSGIEPPPADMGGIDRTPSPWWKS